MKKHWNRFNSIAIIILLTVFRQSSLDARTPENLAGTSIFEINPTIEVKKIISKTVLQDINNVLREVKKNQKITESIELPLTCLNLYFGAEFFQTLAQVFYQHGNIVNLVRKTIPLKHTVAKEEEEEEEEEETLTTDIWHHNFYRDAEQTKPLSYKDCNPIGLLVRFLFWQDPGTSTLQNFHVSKTCMTNDESLPQWADMIAAACCSYVKEDIIFPTKNILNKAWANSFSNNLRPLPDFKKFFKSCVAWSINAGFEKTLPLKVLMAGIYETIGTDSTKIRVFYEKLGLSLKDCVERNGLLKQTTEIDFLELCALPETISPYRIPTKKSDYPMEANESWYAFLMLKKLESGFNPLAYRLTTILDKDLSYKDCAETILRNIICALLLQSDETFNTSLVAEEFKCFFEKFSTTVSQTTPEAYSEWAKLISNRNGFLYKQNDQTSYSYELQASFINILAGLNCIFDLKISSFDSHTISLDRKDAENNKLFIEMTLPLINIELKKKFKIIEKDTNIITCNINENFQDIFGQLILCNINIRNLTLTCSIDCGTHVEVRSVINKNQPPIVLPTIENQNKFPYIKTLLGNNISTIATPNLMSVFLLNPPTTSTLLNLCAFLKKNTANTSLLKMFYATIAELYKEEKRTYISQLGICIHSNLLIEQALATAQYNLKNEQPEIAQAAKSLLSTLIKKGYFHE